ETLLDTRRPYVCRLPSGKAITIFFYHGGLSQSVDFNGLLNDGDLFARSLMEGFDARTDRQLVNIATDGETYGHHHQYGDMALAYCLDQIDNSSTARLTNYAEYLAMTEVVDEVQIHENSSWSCVHGVERWRSEEHTSEL